MVTLQYVVRVSAPIEEVEEGIGALLGATVLRVLSDRALLVQLEGTATAADVEQLPGVVLVVADLPRELHPD